MLRHALLGVADHKLCRKASRKEHGVCQGALLVVFLLYNNADTFSMHVAMCLHIMGFRKTPEGFPEERTEGSTAMYVRYKKNPSVNIHMFVKPYMYFFEGGIRGLQMCPNTHV